LRLSICSHKAAYSMQRASEPRLLSHCISYIPMRQLITPVTSCNCTLTITTCHTAHLVTDEITR
jgi:hypothetical protein